MKKQKSVFLYRERACLTGLASGSLFRRPSRIIARVEQMLPGLAEIENLKRDLEVSVSLLGDPSMKKYNQMYRGKQSTTDVLSFSQLEGEAFPDVDVLFLGDILISVPVCIRQAAEYRVSASQEFDRLMIHGLFHLLGYDHEISALEEKKMSAKEEMLQRWLNKRSLPII